MNNPLPGTTIPAQQPAIALLPIRLGLLAAAFLFCCFPALDLLVRSWSVQDEYGFRFVVPLMTAAWVRHDWPALRALPVRPVLRAGTAVLAGAGLMLLLGRLAPSALLQELALIVVLAALVLLLLGVQLLKRLALPLAFLALMAPVLDPVLERLHWPFQQFAAVSGGYLLMLLGVPVHRTGQFLELPRVTLEVAEACSGVRYLASTLVLSIPLAFITQPGWRKRLILLLVAVVVSLSANPLRVTLIGLWAHYANGDVHGPLHLFHGYAVYLLGLAALFGCAWRLQGTPGHGPEQARSATQNPDRGLREFHPFNQAWFAAFSILLCFGMALQLYTVRPVPLKKNLDTLPGELAGWHLLEPGHREEAGTYSFRYRNASGRKATVTIEYLESQNEERKLVSPQQSFRTAAQHVLLAGPGSGTIRVNQAIIVQQGREELWLFWYRVNGRTLADRSQVKWSTALEGALRRRNNSALVLLACEAPRGQREQAQQELTGLAENLLPLLDEYIP